MMGFCFFFSVRASVSIVYLLCRTCTVFSLLFLEVFVTLKAFSIYDVKGDIFHAPFFMGTNGQALRAFKDLIDDPNTTVGRHPGDYKLCHIGSFDDTTGLLVPVTPVTSLGFGVDFVTSRPMVVPTPVKDGKEKAHAS